MCCRILNIFKRFIIAVQIQTFSLQSLECGILLNSLHMQPCRIKSLDSTHYFSDKLNRCIFVIRLIFLLQIIYWWHHSKFLCLWKRVSHLKLHVIEKFLKILNVQLIIIFDKSQVVKGLHCSGLIQKFSFIDILTIKISRKLFQIPQKSFEKNRM